MRALLPIAAFCTALVIAAAPAPLPAAGFSFVALGNMPYNKDFTPAGYAPFERLIRLINRATPAFSIHIGDFKKGNTPCTDQVFENVRARFMLFE